MYTSITGNKKLSEICCDSTELAAFSQELCMVLLQLEDSICEGKGIIYLPGSGFLSRLDMTQAVKK